MMSLLRAIYHFTLALMGAVWYRFPARSLVVIGVTGTKGKTTTCELVNAMLEAAGHTTALSSTLRFKLASASEQNLKKMSMPGRFFLQHFLRQAVTAGCTHAVLEMTSEGAKQFRHRFIDLDALIFTNLAPEHIESHGSYEKYRAAKVAIARQLARSHKSRRLLVVNGDDKEATHFLRVPGLEKVVVKVSAAPEELDALQLPGEFNRINAALAIRLAQSLGIKSAVIRQALQGFTGVRGRMEEVVSAPYSVIVDYAHTPDSLRAAYGALADRRLICVLGNTGGGRDRWKRPLMGQIAGEHCAHVILTNEDPYDEEPLAILHEMQPQIPAEKLQIILDRREAIKTALTIARPGDAVMITGKGTDPYIMGAGGSKTPWDDATAVREEYKKLNA